MSGFSVGAGYCAQSVAFFNRLATDPGATRAQQYDILIRSLVQSSLWTLMDGLWILAAADTTTACRNLLSGSYALTENNSPTFTADQGYTFDGSTTWLTGPNLSTYGGQSVQDDAHLGVFVRGNAATSNNADIGAANAFIRARGVSGTAIAGRMNNSTGAVAGATVPTAEGHALFSRTAAGAFLMYKNGVLNATSSVASTGVSNETLKIGTGSGVSARQIAAAHFGKGLTAAQIAAINNALQTYMQQIGAI